MMARRMAEKTLRLVVPTRAFRIIDWKVGGSCVGILEC
jgi:hypothetical protein